MWTRTKSFFKSKGILWLFFIFFTYVLPVLLINDKYLLTSSGTTATRLTMSAYWVILIGYIIFRKFLWGRALVYKPGFAKWLCSTLNRLLPLGLISCILYVIAVHADVSMSLIRQIAISVAVGAVFELLYFLKLRGENE